jgi:predicted nucleic acid-binding protein
VISPLDLLLPQSRIFIDANIFLYGALDYTKYRAACRAFLQNVESGTYFAATSALVLNEVVHKLILAETTKTYRLRSESEAKKLIEDKPETISSLTRVWKTYAVIRAYPLVIYSIDKATMDMAADLSSRYGLFISDASHLAVMKMNGISNIVTNDNDFQLAEDISIYKP